MATHRFVPSALATLALVACGETGSAGLTIRATSNLGAEADAGPSTALAFQDDAGTTYTATEALLRIREIELQLPRGVRCSDVESELAGGARCDRGDDEDEIQIRGPFVVDLLTGASTPSLDEVRVPAVTYREVEFELNDDDETGPLAGHSFSVRASYDDAGTPAELVIRLDGDSDVEIERPEGVRVESGQSLVILLDASKWMQGAPLRACIDGKGLQAVDGVVTIDPSTGCNDLMSVLHQRIEDSCDLDDDDRYDD